MEKEEVTATPPGRKRKCKKKEGASLPAGQKPVFEKELGILLSENKEKVHEFKIARKDWIASHGSAKRSSNFGEENEVDELYNGRCNCLRKMGLKTSRLRSHCKTLRPLRYYTLKRTLFEPEQVEEEEGFDQISDDTNIKEVVKVEKSKKERFKWFWRISRNKRKFKWADIIENQKSKMEEVKKKIYTQTSPSSRVIENLKYGKRVDSIVKACKCEAGKEVTVVIKGFCLCDKLNVNKLKSNRVCDEKCKMEIQKAVAEPKLSDSLEIYKRRLGEKKEEKLAKDKNVSLTSLKSLKAVSFRDTKEYGKLRERFKEKVLSDEEQNAKKEPTEKTPKKKCKKKKDSGKTEVITDTENNRKTSVEIKKVEVNDKEKTKEEVEEINDANDGNINNGARKAEIKDLDNGVEVENGKELEIQDPDKKLDSKYADKKPNKDKKNKGNVEDKKVEDVKKKVNGEGEKKEMKSNKDLKDGDKKTEDLKSGEKKNEVNEEADKYVVKETDSMVVLYRNAERKKSASALTKELLESFKKAEEKVLQHKTLENNKIKNVEV